MVEQSNLCRRIAELPSGAQVTARYLTRITLNSFERFILCNSPSDKEIRLRAKIASKKLNFEKMHMYKQLSQEDLDLIKEELDSV